jgi:hypothetical protein
MPRARGWLIRRGAETWGIGPVPTRSSRKVPASEGSPAHPRPVTGTPAAQAICRRVSDGPEADLFRRERSRSVVSSAQRKPRLSFRLPGSLWFRYAARTCRRSLFQEPPRMTRWADASIGHHDGLDQIVPLLARVVRRGAGNETHQNAAAVAALAGSRPAPVLRTGLRHAHRSLPPFAHDPLPNSAQRKPR